MHNICGEGKAPITNLSLNECRNLYKEETNYLESNYPGQFCKVTFDTVLCWPPTRFNETASLKCFEELCGIKYDTSQNATRFCDGNGYWTNKNYSMCKELVIIPEDYATQSSLYFIGFTVSLINLIIAVTIYSYFKDLRCLRNKIHVNLMFSYILMYSTWIVMLTLINYQNKSIALCGLGITLLHYFHVCTFFWMFVEGMYLYILIIRPMSRQIFKLRVYICIGWGIPLIFILIWAIIKKIVHVKKRCPWLYDDNLDWIYMAPPLLVVCLNVFFLFSIMWVLITKLRSSTALETQQHYKAAKALLVLIPLLGITWVITIYVPSTSNLQKIFETVRTTLLSTQGLAISFCYCFLNTDVQNTIKHHFEIWKVKRSIGPHHARSTSNGSSPGYIHHSRRHTEWTLINAEDIDEISRTNNLNNNIGVRHTEVQSNV